MSSGKSISFSDQSTLSSGPVEHIHHLQNIVIIGASVAGHTLTDELMHKLPETHRIILIDALDFSYWPLGSLRASVRPGWEKKIFRPFTQETVFPKDSRHRVVPGTRVVKLRKDAVVLDKPFEGSRVVPFFKAVLATGSSQASPMRVQNGASQADAESILIQMQSEIAVATRVVIIGGGPVGIEMAGEIRSQHPNTGITVIHDGPRILERFVSSAPDLNNMFDNTTLSQAADQHYVAPAANPKLSAALTKLLNDHHVEIITNERAVPSTDLPNGWDGVAGPQDGIKSIRLRSGRTVVADYVFISVGNRFNVRLVEAVDKGALISGMIRVDEFLRVRSTNIGSILEGGYYAIGDCCSTPGWKTMQGAKADGEGVAPNILAEVHNLPVRKYKRPVMHGMLLPMGPEYGRGYMTLPLIGDAHLPEFMVKKVKSGTLFDPDYFLARFNGEDKVEPFDGWGSVKPKQRPKDYVPDPVEMEKKRYIDTSLLVRALQRKYSFGDKDHVWNGKKDKTPYYQYHAA
ncbi:hypothetical protein M231_06548 [Tremella mesenterica]|uniref:FAD/NAD(P)-binding domain-containing protein n=1 Tax=Tremella mesenterica TaxID=5217 RepID=A0A4Q1BE27_TREME|nr:uncharacterized protein TREMEDRAFT_72835 [Tremella mesenterica DSM 1558]EIW72648.1 hypothetical protein TREMEDRAFT_72835 [Tremella mesenterica DSM 1558]RXK36204.1 hypothetical protein M231_06548 [Tremella mesenterica]